MSSSVHRFVNIWGCTLVLVAGLAASGCYGETAAVGAFAPAIVVTQALAKVGAEQEAQAEIERRQRRNQDDPFASFTGEGLGQDSAAPAAGEIRALAAEVDFSICRRVSVRRNFGGHALITVEPDGRVSKVSIDEPLVLPDAVTDCITQRLQSLPITPWKGRAATIGVEWFVP